MDVKEIAAGVAADIRKNGHFQDIEKVPIPALYSPMDESGKCCIFYCPTMFAGDRDERIRLLSKALEPYAGNDFIIAWQDRESTEKVLETLDKIASGE